MKVFLIISLIMTAHHSIQINASESKIDWLDKKRLSFLKVRELKGMLSVCHDRTKDDSSKYASEAVSSAEKVNYFTKAPPFGNNICYECLKVSAYIWPCMVCNDIKCCLFCIQEHLTIYHR